MKSRLALYKSVRHLHADSCGTLSPLPMAQNPEHAPVSLSDVQRQFYTQLKQATAVATFLRENLPAARDASIQVPIRPGSTELITADHRIEDLAVVIMWRRLDDLHHLGLGKTAWRVVRKYYGGGTTT